ncbi:MAG TPA: SGNH/GDSL hydrolase family protein [Polyangiaceae bacterium]|nr:SGNH/GDSL hydrolase family protein [Polyangiaceae bacterium]
MQFRRHFQFALSKAGSSTIFALCLSVSAACSGPGADGGSGGTSTTAGAGSGGKSAAGGTATGGSGTGGAVTGSAGSQTGGSTGEGTGGAPTTGGAGAGGSGGAGVGVGGSITMGGRAGAGGGVSGGPSMGGSAGRGGAGNGGSSGAGTFDPCPASDACKILPLGDSITFGIQYEGAWRVELFTKAVAANKKITFVGSQMNGPAMAGGMAFPKNHEGHSGYTIDQMKPFAMTTDVPYMPNMILLHIGTNDTYGSSPAAAPTRLSSLVDLITSTYPNALLVVAKIVPYPSQAANVKIINDSIPDLVAKNQTAGKHVIMADCFTGFTTSSMLSSDSIHPNQTGYNFMGDQFYSVISSYLH